ncbi:MAG: 50S ribosomal protein L4 [Candidatus Shapirobacteria bacterium]
MLKVNLYNLKGETEKKILLPKKVFGVKVNLKLLAQAVRVFLANQRRAGAKSKTRGEVARSTRKIYRQKGTGRARHGSKGAPIFVGGGVAHGPTGEQNYKLRLSKKMRKAALPSALTSKLESKEVWVVAGLSKAKGKTKEIEKLLKTLKITGKTSLILPERWEKTVRAARNIEKMSLFSVKQLNAYAVLNGGKLVLAAESLEVLK